MLNILHTTLQDLKTSHSQITIEKKAMKITKTSTRKPTFMEYDCHIFSKYLVFQMKNLVFQPKYLVFRSKTLDFDRTTRYFESEILKY